MSNTFEDRVEEVLGTLHGMAWPLLEESDKRRIVGKVVQGIDKYGDKQAWWERALGVAHSTLSDRIVHFRRSEAIDGPRADGETQRKRMSHARSVMRDESVSITERVELVKEALADPLVRASVQNHIERPVDIPARMERHADIDEQWQAWLTRINSLLLEGARLAERSEGERLGAHSGAALAIYERLSSRKLDAELKDLLGVS